MWDANSTYYYQSAAVIPPRLFRQATRNPRIFNRRKDRSIQMLRDALALTGFVLATVIRHSVISCMYFYISKPFYSSGLNRR